MMWYLPGMGWWMIVGSVLALVFLVTVITLGVWALRQVTRAGGNDVRKAVDIARERYARGEISREEFDRLRRDLQHS